MSKWLAIFGLLLASAPVMPGQPDQASKPKQSTANQVQKESNPVGATEVDKQASGQTDQAKAEANPPDWYTALERPDWWLVIVATITAGVICWQSIETRKAAQGAKENAEAALSQIRMTMEKERARIGVDLVDLKLDVVPDQHSAVEVGWSVTLYGQTDAFIHDSQCFAEVEGQNLPHHIRPAWGEMVGLPSVLSCDRRNVKGNVMGHPPVSYTHLDVYKRQTQRHEEAGLGVPAPVAAANHGKAADNEPQNQRRSGDDPAGDPLGLLREPVARLNLHVEPGWDGAWQVPAGDQRNGKIVDGEDLFLCRSGALGIVCGVARIQRRPVLDIGGVCFCLLYTSRCV